MWGLGAHLTLTCPSCRGLKVLVDLLDEDYTEQEELVVHALNGIGSVFELQSPTTKNDFCRMFIREGLLDPLSLALLNVMAIRGESTLETKMKIIQTLLVFCQVSQSDVHVRNALGTRQVIRRELSYYLDVYPGADAFIHDRAATGMRTFGTRMSRLDAQGR